MPSAIADGIEAHIVSGFQGGVLLGVVGNRSAAGVVEPHSLHRALAFQQATVGQGPSAPPSGRFKLFCGQFATEV